MVKTPCFHRRGRGFHCTSLVRELIRSHMPWGAAKKEKKRKEKGKYSIPRASRVSRRAKRGKNKYFSK